MCSWLSISVRMVPMITVMGTIFFFSHQPGDQLNLPSIPFLDKIVHLLLYGLLAATILYVPSGDTRRQKPKTVCAVALLISLLYGISDEYHQSFIPGRDASVGDLAADLLGIIIVLAAWLHLRK